MYKSRRVLSLGTLDKNYLAKVTLISRGTIRSIALILFIFMGCIKGIDRRSCTNQEEFSLGTLDKNSLAKVTKSYYIKG